MEVTDAPGAGPLPDALLAALHAISSPCSAAQLRDAQAGSCEHFAQHATHASKRARSKHAAAGAHASRTRDECATRPLSGWRVLLGQGVLIAARNASARGFLAYRAALHAGVS